MADCVKCLLCNHWTCEVTAVRRACPCFEKES